MAARKRKFREIDLTRHKIRCTQLVERLTKHAMGELPLDQTQVRAIEILLRKVLPDLSAVDATLDGDMRNHVVSDKPMTESDWEAAYAVVNPAGRPRKTEH